MGQSPGVAFLSFRGFKGFRGSGAVAQSRWRAAGAPPNVLCRWPRARPRRTAGDTAR